MMTKENIKTYTELMQLETLEERFEYLKLSGGVGVETFGYDRYINQMFYTSKEWNNIRNEIIVRDRGCDLGVPGHEIGGSIYVHHMNPLDINDIEHSSDFLLNPEYLICCSLNTHNAIHYGNIENLKNENLIVRAPNDTSPWKK